MGSMNFSKNRKSKRTNAGIIELIGKDEKTNLGRTNLSRKVMGFLLRDVFVWFFFLELIMKMDVGGWFNGLVSEEKGSYTNGGFGSPTNQRYHYACVPVLKWIVGLMKNHGTTCSDYTTSNQMKNIYYMIKKMFRQRNK